MTSLLSIRYTSKGYFASLNLVYGQLLSLLSVLLSMSIMMLSTISCVDVVNDQGLTVVVTTIQIVTIISVLLQLSLLVITLVFTFFHSLTDYDTFLLSISQASTTAAVRYGATTDTNINEEDISVFYQRIPRVPDSLPLTGWTLPAQFVSLLLVLILFCLHLSLAGNSTVVLVVLVNFLQQFLLVLVTYLTSTDTGFCCPGVSVIRWFPHTDRYTQVVQSCVRQGFSETMRKPRDSRPWFHKTIVSEEEDNSLDEVDTSEEKMKKVEVSRKNSRDVTDMREWFRGSVVNENHENNFYDAGEQVKLLQNLLEKVHDELYRTVLTTSTERLVSLFVARKEMILLDQYFINKHLESTAENVIYQAGQ